MKKYYIIKNNLQQGPFTIEELYHVNISKSTLIWAEGLDDWINADKIDELKEVFMKKPPAIPTSANANEDKQSLSGVLMKSKAIIVLMLFGVFLIFIGFEGIVKTSSRPIADDIDLHKSVIEIMAKEYHWFERPSQDEFIERVVQDRASSMSFAFYMVFVGSVLLFIGIIIIQRKFLKFNFNKKQELVSLD